ncbi:hypothetical protein CTAYLR_002273 [Chrysophaeum taylorii]|uniref:polyribonucleotide nucleotidyltransferase n=1 Tax=Chrysophaeum taylorii TaxID=2483200 RepID=A0AAD7XRK4_9STRA|nr:hypothetical protein CTAYLR_002273 [Chrysophaeum taylorii]
MPAEADGVEIPMGDGAEAVRLETGRMGRQADAAVYTTLCIGRDEGGGDFVPMSVEYQERHSAWGKTAGTIHRRDGRPADKEILISRLIDRPLRPTIADGWCPDIQIVSCVVAFDGVHSPETLAILGASAALQLSRVPTICAVGASRVTRIEGAWALDPGIEAAKGASLSMVVAGAGKSVLMVEGGADFVPESDVVEALALARREAERTGTAIGAWADELRAAGKIRPKLEVQRPYPKALEEAILRDAGDQISASVVALTEGNMTFHRETLENLEASVLARLEAYEEDYTRSDAKRALKKLCEKAMISLIRSKKVRCDGREIDVVRPIDVEMTPLPTAHGSAVFTRGETQSLATCTLGDRSMALREFDAFEDERTDKLFYLQYSFPPSSVGETGRVGLPGRREVGHGALAERALRPAIPEEGFDYAVRVESLVTESCGSSSMASVCGGCLALMDAGVPIDRTVAGVAMGVLLDDPEDPVVLTDILGVEDALGSMDFKVAGDVSGISAFQLDVKRLGLTVDTLASAIDRARTARLHVIDKMLEACPGPRDTLHHSVPRQKKINVPPNTVGKLIGPGGRTINAIIQDTGITNIDVDGATGEVIVSATNDTAIAEAFARVTALCLGGGGGGDAAANNNKYDGPFPDVNRTYTGVVTDVKSFGVFVEFDDFPGLEGLCHISELAVDRIRSIERFIQAGKNITVKVISIDTSTQKIGLSRKALLVNNNNQQNNNKSRIKDNGASSPRPRAPRAPPQTEKDEQQQQQQVV